MTRPDKFCRPDPAWPWPLLVLALLALLAACGGGGGTAPDPVPPAITTQPAAQGGVAGTAASFSVVASGSNLTYQWQRSLDGGSTWADIVGATTATYTLGSLDVAMNGQQFRAVVRSGTLSATTAAATLSVGAAVAPAITLQPLPLNVVQPATATFMVAATGAPAPGFQWQMSSDNGATYGDIAGATAASYITAATAAADSGRLYRVRVANGAGSVDSNAVRLTVETGVPAFTPLTATMATARALHTATLLRDGKVLITGGVAAGSFPMPALDSAELFDPATGVSVMLAATLRSPRVQHAATLLGDGRVLITGGQVDTLDGDGSDTAELYDPATQTFTLLAARLTGLRGAHGATRLADGRVLLTGGFGNNPGVDTAELYDPATGRFTALAARLTSLRDTHTATLLADGKVLLAAGLDGNVVVDKAELYDPVAQTFTPLAGRLQNLRGGHAASLLASGRVLLTGGATVFSATDIVVLDSAELFDPASGTFVTLPATLGVRRIGHAQVRLDDGTVLLIGGGTSASAAPGPFQVTGTMELFRP